MTKDPKRSRTLYTRVLAAALLLSIIAFGAAYVLTPVQKGHNSIAKVHCDMHVTCVSLQGKQAVPDSVPVIIGDYVQFNSADNRTHNISLDAGDPSHAGHVMSGTLTSGDFKGDEAWKTQFTAAGTYTFVDKYHPEAKILVVAYLPGGDYKIK